MINWEFQIQNIFFLRFGIDDVEYRESITRSQPIAMDCQGKSGAKFYRSYDKLFIIKSLTSEEVERYLKFLSHLGSNWILQVLDKSSRNIVLDGVLPQNWKYLDQIIFFSIQILRLDLKISDFKVYALLEGWCLQKLLDLAMGMANMLKLLQSDWW